MCTRKKSGCGRVSRPHTRRIGPRQAPGPHDRGPLRRTHASVHRRHQDRVSRRRISTSGARTGDGDDLLGSKEDDRERARVGTHSPGRIDSWLDRITSEKIVLIHTSARYPKRLLERILDEKIPAATGGASSCSPGRTDLLERRCGRARCILQARSRASPRDRVRPRPAPPDPDSSARARSRPGVRPRPRPRQSADEWPSRSFFFCHGHQAIRRARQDESRP